MVQFCYLRLYVSIQTVFQILMLYLQIKTLKVTMVSAARLDLFQMFFTTLPPAGGILCLSKGSK